MSLPNIRVFIKPDASFIVSGNMVLGTSTLSLSSLLGPSTASFYEISDFVTGVSVRRGRTRVTDSFDTGTATIQLIDRTGLLNPDNTSSPLNGWVLPLRQIRITATIDGTEHSLFNGYTGRYSYDYQQGINAAFISIECNDAFRILNLATITTVTGAADNQDTGTRIGQILSTSGVPNSIVSLDTGTSNLGDDPAVERTVLEAVQQAETSELGAFYISADGIFTFKSRHNVQKLASGEVVSTIYFDDTGTVGGAIPFVEVSQSFDDEQVYNDVTVVDENGNIENFTDATSEAAYFQRSLEKSGTLIRTAAEAADHATFLLAFRKDPFVVIDSITVSPLALSTTQATSIIVAELLEPISVSKQYGADIFTRTLTLQGVEHDISPSTWTTRLSTAEPVSGDGFILDSTSYGVLDQNELSF
jgi:hypothetical protein